MPRADVAVGVVDGTLEIAAEVETAGLLLGSALGLLQACTRPTAKRSTPNTKAVAPRRPHDHNGHRHHACRVPFMTLPCP